MHLQILHIAAILFLASKLGFSAAECNGDESACDPRDILKGRSSSKTCYSHEDTLTYECAGTLHGPPDNTCINGKWERPMAIDCEDFTCDIPTNDPFVILNPRKSIYTAREKVTVMCHEDYILEGPVSQSCDPGGWNPPTIAACFKKCRSPTIEHGRAMIGSPVKQGDTAKVVCDNGYVIHVGQSNRITCGHNGEWEHLPQCVKENNKAPNDL